MPSIMPRPLAGQTINRKHFSDAELNMKVGAYLPPARKWKSLEHFHSYANAIKAQLISTRGMVESTYRDRELSLVGKRNKAKEKALNAMKLIDGSPTAELARMDFEERRAELGRALDAERIPPKDTHEALVTASVREKLAAMKPAERTMWLHQHEGDAFVARAVLTAPAFLFDMTPAEQEAFAQRAQQALHPQEFEELRDLEKAAGEIQRSLRNAEEMLAGAAELRRARDGKTWLAPDEPDTTVSAAQVAMEAEAAKARMVEEETQVADVAGETEQDELAAEAA